MQSEISTLYIVITSAFFGLLLVIFVISFLLITQKRSFKYIENIAEMKKQYESAILKSQIEVQAQTLQHISEEIHDNIGQLLQTTRLNLININRNLSGEQAQMINETKEIVVDISAELRHLSKSISSKRLADFGLAEAINYQIMRINKSNEMSAEMVITGENKKFNPEIELVIFRMVQEVLNNAIKHSRGSEIKVHLTFTEQSLSIVIADNGTGFTNNTSDKKFSDGSGLFSLKEKAKNINCDLNFVSNSEGTSVTITKYFKNETY
ncbi:MAG: ATP-binding protein [Bacteroidota bacterium]